MHSLWGRDLLQRDGGLCMYTSNLQRRDVRKRCGGDQSHRSVRQYLCCWDIQRQWSKCMRPLRGWDLLQCERGLCMLAHQLQRRGVCQRSRSYQSCRTVRELQRWYIFNRGRSLCLYCMCIWMVFIGGAKCLLPAGDLLGPASLRWMHAVMV